MKRPATSRRAKSQGKSAGKPPSQPARRAQPLPATHLQSAHLQNPAFGKRGGETKSIAAKRAGTLSATIYADLRRELVSLTRLPDEVVSELEIAKAYGVSRTPVREAILKLADEGLIEIFPQSGIFVSRIPVAALPEAILIRTALEQTTARIAAAQASASQILVLQALLQSQREAASAGDRDSFHHADEMFHAAIADVAGHPGIWTLIQQVKVHVDRYRRLTLPQPGRMERAIAEHEIIMAAIVAHDPGRAVAAIGAHLDGLLADIAATRELNPDLFQAADVQSSKTQVTKIKAPKKPVAKNSVADSQQKRRARK
jgi:DNA-binding GntR family transcriptional regulator